MLGHLIQLLFCLYVGHRQGAELQKRLKAGLQGLMLWGQLLPFHLLSWLLLKLLFPLEVCPGNWGLFQGILRSWVGSQDASYWRDAGAWSTRPSRRVCCGEADPRGWRRGAQRAETWWPHRKQREQSSSLSQGGRARLQEVSGCHGWKGARKRPGSRKSHWVRSLCCLPS